MRKLALVLLIASIGCKAQSTEGESAPARATPASANAGAAAAAPAPAPGQPPSIPAPPDVAAPPADAVRTATGLATKVLAPGTGTAHPSRGATATVHYTGWTTDGRMFDSSRVRGNPATFPLGRVIPGWTEGLQLMVQGEKRRLWIPVELAYQGQPGMPEGMLVFDVELISFVEPPPAPDDVAAPPTTAQCADNHLCTRVLAPGTGTTHPTANAVARIHYTGWTTDGNMFDSSVARGEPVEFPMANVVPGFSQGIQLMVQGEKRRLWIPQDLAYQGRPGKPAGMLVFDVELLSFVEPPAVPTDVAAPPRNAECAANHLCSRRLSAGTGTNHPGPGSVVRVHYSGWTTDGNMFDSSVVRGEPAEFPMNGVVPGFSQGIQLMVEGEKRRLWIPQDLAYQGRPGAPPGMLVFDVELVAIVRP